MKSIDPKSVGLTARDRAVEITTGHIALVVDRRGRIIMSDGQRIKEKIEKVKSRYPAWRVSLMTQTAICSKTRVFFAENGIDIIDPQDDKV